MANLRTTSIFLCRLTLKRGFSLAYMATCLKTDITGNVASRKVSVVRSQVYKVNHPVLPYIILKSFALISSTKVAKNNLNSGEEATTGNWLNILPGIHHGGILCINYGILFGVYLVHLAVIWMSWEEWEKLRSHSSSVQMSRLLFPSGRVYFTSAISPPSMEV